MLTDLRNLFWKLLFCMLFIAFIQPALASPTHDRRHLTFVLILTRHGVRAPGATPQRLGRYSVDPWPRWPAPPDYLTEHGYKVIRRFGAWDRNWLISAGLLAPSVCNASSIYIYTDSDQRTIRSGHALAQGLSPSCTVTVHSLPQDTHDPLFHLPAQNLDAATRAHAVAAVRNKFPGGLKAFTASHQRQLELLQSVLDGCKPGVPCLRKKQPEIRLKDIPSHIEITHSHDIVSVKGPVFTAAGLSEDILLEYTQGLPRNQVAWGRLDRSQLREIIDLHTAEFSIRHRTLAIARVQISNLFEHILLTLQQAAQGSTVEGAFGPAGKKLVIVDGHDTDIAAIAGLLHLHWTLDGRSDDTPPGTQLQFLVFRDGHGHTSIQLRIVMQTLEQMRYARPLTKFNPPVSATLKPSGCKLKGRACSWKSFEEMATGAIDPRYVVPLKH